MPVPGKNSEWDRHTTYSDLKFAILPPKFPYLPIVDDMDVEHRIENKLNAIESKLNSILEDRNIYKKVNGILLPSWKEF